MVYTIYEIFYTLQGEGANAGRPAVFCRFAGCNLWTGREQHREKAVCKFCDTEFVGTGGGNGGKFRVHRELAERIASIWEINTTDNENRFVVCTGGEPLLQLDQKLVDCLHELKFMVAVETNGTKPVPDSVDWLCVSPKSTANLVIKSGNELKLVYPQTDAPPERFESMEFDHFYLQPMDGPNLLENTNKAINYCKSNPRWKLSIQTHKLLGVP